MTSISSIFSSQQKYFKSGITLSLDFRREQLRALASAIHSSERDILQALWSDLHKCEYESFLGEVGYSFEEIRFALRNLSKWARPERVKSHWAAFPSRARIYSEPKGVTLILAPWNYPFQLMISPLIGSMAAGNCSVLKPSELAPATSSVIARLIRENFDPSYLAAVEGGVEASQQLLGLTFDHIFSPAAPKWAEWSCRQRHRTWYR